jgi:ankyrin repeat protein
MSSSDAALRDLVNAIAAGDSAKVSRLLADYPELAASRFEATNVTRLAAKENLIPSIGRYIYRGDTALHFAAAGHDPQIASTLISKGADVRAKNRLGDEPLIVAAIGNPGSDRWNPAAQAAVIRILVNAGADPNAVNKMGVSPLHKAVRTRCSEAVRALLESGADPAKKNKQGSDAMLLARLNTGRGGSGSEHAKAEQQKILELLG